MELKILGLVLSFGFAANWQYLARKKKKEKSARGYCLSFLALAN